MRYGLVTIAAERQLAAAYGGGCVIYCSGIGLLLSGNRALFVTAVNCDSITSRAAVTRATSVKTIPGILLFSNFHFQ